MLPERAIKQFSPFESHSFLVLVAFQFLFAPVALINPEGLASTILHTGYRILIVISVINAARHPAQVMLGVGLVLAGAVARDTAVLPVGDRLWVSDAFGVAALSVVLVLSIRRFFVGTRVTPALISGAVGIYLLAGIPFAQIYGMIDAVSGPAFLTPDGDAPTRQDLHYFSYTTMTTLGYGDISPVHPLARSLALGQAVFGQMFVVVLLGRLVALQVSSDQKRGESGV